MNFFSSFDVRATEAECMDLPDCDESRLFHTLDQFHRINLLLSRVRGLLKKTVLKQMKPGTSYHLVDLRAGACDIPVWLLHQAERRGLDLRITAVDADPRVARYARDRYGHIKHLTILQADALDLDSLSPFDVLFANHFLHHLPDDTLRILLQDATRLSRMGVIFSDLRRSPWSYLGFWVAALMFRNSFTREDGLLSIRKGFQPQDFQELEGFQILTALPGRIQLLGGSFATPLQSKG